MLIVFYLRACVSVLYSLWCHDYLSIIHFSQVFYALLNVLASQPPLCALIQWHTGWFMRKLLNFQVMALGEQHLHLFNVRFQPIYCTFKRKIPVTNRHLTFLFASPRKITTSNQAHSA